MMIYRIASVLLLVGVADAKHVTTHDLETDREPAFLSPGVRAVGEYIDSMQMNQTTKMEIAGQAMNQETSMNMQTDTKVSEGSFGYDIDMEITHFAMKMTMPGMSLEFDTDNPDEGSPELGPIVDMVGTLHHMEVDEEGNIVDSVAESEQEISPQIPGNPGFSPRKGFEQMSRMLDALPEDSVKPFDEWDASVDMGDMGEFIGKAKLRGYMKIAGHECAVITTEGTMQIDTEKIMEALGGNFANAGAPLGFTIAESTMKSTMYWDDVNKFARWTKTEMTTIMDFPNPLDPDGDHLQIPVAQSMKMSTKLVAE